MSSMISLTKGQNISLTKEAPGLRQIVVGLGWEENTFDGADFDLDASAIMLGENGKVRTPADFIFYGQPESACGSIRSTGDNQTGDADGDDEQLIVDMSKIPADVKKVVFVVSIYSAKARKQSFGLVNDAYIRLINAEKLPLPLDKLDDVSDADLTKATVSRYDLTENYSTETAMVFAELYRNGGEWKFKAVGQGFNNGLGGVGRSYGLPLEDEKE